MSYFMRLLKYNQNHAPAGNEHGGEFSSGANSGFAAQKASDLAALAARIPNLLAQDFLHEPIVNKAVDEMLKIPKTNEMHGYGTPEWEANRQFHFGGQTVIGYHEAVDRLTQQAEAYAGKGGPKANKQAYILIGPPAAGKSTIGEKLATDTNSAIVDPDDAKKVLPEYHGGIGANAVHAESQELSARVLHGVMEEGLNLVLPRVGHSINSINELIGPLKNHGYDVHLVNMKVSITTAMRRMMGRFIQTGRLINPGYLLNMVGEKPSATFQHFKADPRIKSYANLNGEVKLGENPTVLEATGYLASHYKS